MEKNRGNNPNWRTIFCVMAGMFLSNVLFRTMLPGVIVGMLIGWMIEKLKKDD